MKRALFHFSQTTLLYPQCTQQRRLLFPRDISIIEYFQLEGCSIFSRVVFATVLSFFTVLWNFFKGQIITNLKSYMKTKTQTSFTDVLKKKYCDISWQVYCAFVLGGGPTERTAKYQVRHWKYSTITNSLLFLMSQNSFFKFVKRIFNPLNAELNPISHLLALLGAHHILHVSGLRVK